MNNKKAKRIRRDIYGEMSSKNPQYETEDHVKLIKVKDKLKRVKTSTVDGGGKPPTKKGLFGG